MAKQQKKQEGPASSKSAKAIKEDSESIDNNLDGQRIAQLERAYSSWPSLLLEALTNNLFGYKTNKFIFLNNEQKV